MATTWVGLQYPELYERNPLANPFLEVAGVLGGQAVILSLGERWRVSPNVVEALALAPTALPFYAALNNSLLIAEAYAKRNPEKVGLIRFLAPFAVGTVVLAGAVKG